MKRITSLAGGSKNFTRNSRIVTKEHQGHYLNDPMNNIPTDVHYFDTQSFRVIISQRFFYSWTVPCMEKVKEEKVSIFFLFLSLSFFFFLYERYNIACFNFLVLAVFFVEQSWFSLFVINAVSHFVMLAIFKKKKNQISIFFFFCNENVTFTFVSIKNDRHNAKSIIMVSSVFVYTYFFIYCSR